MSHDITRIEGNAKIIIEYINGKVNAKINIYESSREFEKFLIGKNYKEVPDLVSRICGICHVPHKLCGIMAIENALNIKVSEQTEKLRELLTLGSIMHSHILHLFFMVLPDIKGYDNVFEMMKKYKNLVEIGLNLENLSELIIKTIGGREVHTLTPVIGGFTKLPKERELKNLLKLLKENKENAIKTIEIFSKYKRDLKFKRKTQYLSLRRDKNYEVLYGNIICDKSTFKPEEYRKYIKEYEVHYSTSKFATFKNNSYMVGALSRLINNGKYLPKKVKKYIRIETNSPFSNNIAQAIEILYCIEKAIEIIENLKLKKEKIKFKSKESEGIAVTEAPRGILIHHYKINKNGKIKYANVITPTAQNLRNIEEDVKEFIKYFTKKKDIIYFLERLVRAYDPCISCATHFLEVKFQFH